MKFIKPVTITDAILNNSNVPEDDYPVWSDSATYNIGDRVIRTNKHRIYESLQAGNTNKIPEDEPTWWLDISPTNRWAMFDETVGTTTTIASQLVVTLSPGIINSLAILDVLYATTINVKMTNDGQTVYDKTFDMADDTEILDWYMYFFEPITPKSDLVITDLPPYSNGIITVTINSDDNVSCGTLVVGNLVKIGCTRYGANLGITDYSVKETDDFGVISVTERRYAKRLEASVEVKNKDIDYIARNLSAVRATPVVWIADNDTGMASNLIIYGFYKDWGIDIAYPYDSIASFTIEGLT